jgi:hypothetical protein
MRTSAAALTGAMLLVLGCANQSVAGDAPALEALVNATGVMQLQSGGHALCSFNIGLFEKDWKGANASGSFANAGDSDSRKFKLHTSSNVTIDGVAEFTSSKDGINATYSFTPAADVSLNALDVSVDFAAEVLAGGTWTADDKQGSFPAEFKDVHLHAAPLKTLEVTLASGLKFKLVFDKPTQVLLQDNRKWGPTFSLRMGPQGDGIALKKGETTRFGFTLSTAGVLNLKIDKPVTIVAGPEWIPFKLELDIEPGSALDFSELVSKDAPAGKFGRVITSKAGNQFVFEKDPETPRRFYGVNLCFGAQYLTHEESDRLAERLMRIGYNAVRIHHYEGELTKDQPVSTQLNPQKLEQLDYLLAAFEKRGLYITTDLFVSRPVKWSDVGIDNKGNVPMDTFKALVPVVPKAFENWKAFAKSLLDHVNPYTKLRYAEDPGLAWLSMINEGNFGNAQGEMRKIPEWNKEWNAWLAKQYPDRAALEKAWGVELHADEDPAKGSVGLPPSIYDNTIRVRDCAVFYADVEREMIKRMKDFLRNELKCNALITNSNSWTNFLSSQLARNEYDYVDDHFYVDHPQFIERPWSLPSRCPNTSPIAAGAPGGRNCAFTRLFDKPFTITEYNYAAPGRYRGVGGILTGALGALQGWGGIWRFAYSHSHGGMFEPGRMDYFNMASDPLGQAAERASLCLFLRGDMKAAPHNAIIHTGTSAAFAALPMPHLSPSWDWIAWITRVGTLVCADNKIDPLKPASLQVSTAWAEANPYQMSNNQVIELVRNGQDALRMDTDHLHLGKKIYSSETDEITIDGSMDKMTLDTSKTAGGYAPAGSTVATGDGRLSITMIDSEATAWVSSLDGKPITESKHLLLTHLTDLQNTEIKYAEGARQTLLDWGKLPHLVRAGKATIKLKNSGDLKVFALASSGKRLGEVKSTKADGVLSFIVDVSEDAQANGARMIYELTEK